MHNVRPHFCNLAYAQIRVCAHADDIIQEHVHLAFIYYANNAAFHFFGLTVTYGKRTKNVPFLRDDGKRQILTECSNYFQNSLLNDVHMQ